MMKIISEIIKEPECLIKRNIFTTKKKNETKNKTKPNKKKKKPTNAKNTDQSHAFPYHMK